MSDRIKVAVRMRPLIDREVEENALVQWQAKDSKVVYQITSPSVKFRYDQVFDSEKSNEEVYSEFCSPIVESVIGGFNGTIFAYGQTSSGKTYTLTGDDEKDIRGIIHYTIYDIFNTIQNMPEREFLLRVSVMEIYNEHVFDLLSEKSENLKLHEDQDGHVNVCGLSEEVVQNSNQVFELMKICQKKRKTGDTLMNERSSRSHLIFRMIIESELRGVENAAVIVSQFNLVDLAGSERVAQTGAKGVRFKESININKSLSMLSHVISQLSVKPIRFISYRGSKLTRILQNSLGGNAKTAIICTITPVSIDDTLSTLKFARRAKCIKNKPEVNKVEGEEALLNRYANEIKKLNEQLQAKEGETLGKEKLQRENEDLQRQIQELKLKFVSQLVPEYEKPAFPKASRRETWGGSLDEARIRNLLTQKKARKQTLQLSMLEEESETETNYSDNEDICDPFFPIPRDMKDTEVQTEVILYLPEQKAVEDAEIQCQLPVCNLCEARKMKEQNERLKSELGGLKEFTTLERQIFSAESQLSKDLEASRNEVVMLRERLSKDSNSISIHKSFDNISFNGCNSFYSEALIHDYEKTQNFHVSNVVNDAFSNSKNISTNINSEETKHSSEDQISNYLVDMHSTKSLSSLAENDAKDASSFICVCAKQKTTTFIPTDLPKLNISCQTEIYEDVEDGHSVNFEVAVFVNEMTELAAHLSEIVEKITHFRFSENIDEIYKEKDSTLNSVRKKIHVMKEQLTILDSDIRLKAESFDYLNNTFKPKMTEVLSMQTQLVETQTVLKEKECLLLDMQNDLYSLRQKMSLLKSMYKHTLSPNPDSEAESVHEEKECISDKTSLSCIHDIATMERILLELESYFIRNNATVSELSSKLIEAEAEISILQAMTSELQNVEILKFNRYTQTSENYQIENHAELNRFKSKAETFENEVICLQTEIKILNDAKLALEQELEDAKLLYSSQVNSLQSEYEIHKNIWHSKTAEFMKSLEDEHRQEIADIENKCSNYISEKTKELKKQVILLESEKEELKKMLNNLKTVFEDQVSMLKIDKEKNMVDFQARLSNEITEKENLKHQISEKENKLNLLRIKCQNADDLNAQLTQKLNQDTNEIQKLKEILSNMMKNHSDEPRSLLHTQTKENKTSACENCNILSQQTPTSESDLNKKNAKINLLQTDNRNLMRELDILKKEVTAKTALLRICKCNNIPKIKGSEPSKMESSSKIHISGKISDSNSERRKIRQQSSELSNSASMLDTKAVLNQDFVQKAIADAREEERALLTGGGSGEANILKAYWLERELHKKDKKIKELEEKLSRPYYNPRRTSPDKFKKTKNPFGLSEDTENVTACPEFIYFKDAIPAAPRKGAIPVPPQKILCEKNGQFNIKSPKFKIEIPEMQSTSETKGKLTKGKKSENLIFDEPGCKQQ